MWSNIRYKIACLLFLLIIQTPAWSQTRIVEYLPRPMPNTPLLTLDGKEYSLDKLEGNVLLIHFWATWCSSCIEEIKALNEFQKLLRKDKVIVIPVSEDFKGPDVVKKFYNELNLNYLPAFVDKNNQWFRSMKVNSLPATFVVDVQGRNVALLAGGIDWLNQKSIDKIKTFVSDKQSYNLDYMKLISEHVIVDDKTAESNGKPHLDEVETKVTPAEATSEQGEMKMINASQDFQTRRSINKSLKRPASEHTHTQASAIN